MKKSLFYLFSFHFCVFYFMGLTHVVSQAPVSTSLNDVSLPQYLPPSPDVASMSRNVELGINNHTGAATTSIPLYTLKLGDFSLPISASYVANGFKPKESPSRLGVGWSLQAGGAVSRIIHGKDDFLCNAQTDPVLATPFVGNQNSYNELLALSNKYVQQDAMPDEYRFNAPGLSGKFLIKRDNSIIQFPYSRNKIDLIKSGTTVNEIHITNTQGVIYKFGTYGEKEFTDLQSSSTSGFLNKDNTVTAWMLSEIVLPYGGKIVFDYVRIPVSKITKSSTASLGDNPTYYTNSWPVSCNISNPPSLCDPVIQTKTVTNYTIYSCLVLSRITSIGNGLEPNEEVNFYYQFQTNLPNSDQQLITVKVVNKLSNRHVKEYKFNYTPVYRGSNSVNRFFLNKVEDINPANPQEVLTYTIDYWSNVLPDDPDYCNNMFYPYSYFDDYEDDFLGYANRQGCPSNPEYIQTKSTDPLFANDINKMLPNGRIAQNGMLKRVTFPTGGYQQYEYEPNLKTEMRTVPDPEYTRAHLEGPGQHTYTRVFTTNMTQQIEFYFSSHWLGTPQQVPVIQNETDLPDPSLGNPNEEYVSGHNFLSIPQNFTLTNLPQSITAIGRLHEIGPNGQLIFKKVWLVRGFTGFPGYQLLTDPNPITNTITAGKSYEFSLEVRYGAPWNYTVTGDIVYKNNKGDVFKEVHEELCGIRVKEIASYDPLTKVKSSKYYTYKNVFENQQTSAKVLYEPKYIKFIQGEKTCSNDDQGNSTTPFIIECGAKSFSTINEGPVDMNQGSAVVYEFIAESDHPDFIHGGVQYSFNIDNLNTIYFAHALHGFDITDRVFNPYTKFNGTVRETVYFDKDFNQVKRIANQYSEDQSVYDVLDNAYLVERVYETSFPEGGVTTRMVYQFNVAKVKYVSNWVRLDETITTEYESNQPTITTRNVYEYSNLTHLQPTGIRTFVNNEEVSYSIKKYPVDFTGDPGCDLLTQMNMIDVVIEEEFYRNNRRVYRSQSEYQPWHNGLFAKPSVIIKQKADLTSEPRMRIHKYDVRGNALDLSKENDVHVSYTWNHDFTVPDAQVINGRHGENIAYTSFETKTKNGWKYDGEPVNTDFVTGFYAYSLAQGSVTTDYPISGQDSYIISLWLKNNSGSAFANGQSGEFLIEKSGWKLFKYVLNDFAGGSITVSGSGLIDELRLHPKNAMMKTYAHIPGVGVKELSDENAVYQRFEYDGFGRLIRIRDWDNNILKEMEYKYNQLAPDCDQPNANWVATGNVRCKVNNVQNNANTGMEEKEEKDENNCSPTYLQLRWVDVAPSSNCPEQTCLGIDKRMVNGICEVGIPTQVKSIYLGNMQWKCLFKYMWSDGFIGPEQVSFTNQPCPLSVSQF